MLELFFLIACWISLWLVGYLLGRFFFKSKWRGEIEFLSMIVSALVVWFLGPRLVEIARESIRFLGDGFYVTLCVLEVIIALSVVKIVEGEKVWVD